MASKYKGSKDDLLKNMRKEGDAASKKAAAKAQSDKNPTPKKFQGADKAADKAAPKVADPAVAEQPSMARQILDKLRSPKGMGAKPPFDAEGARGDQNMPNTAPRTPGPRMGPPPDGMPTTGNGDMNVEDMASPAKSLRADPGARIPSMEEFAGKGSGGHIGALLAIGGLLAAIKAVDPDNFEKNMMDSINPMSTARKIRDLGTTMAEAGPKHQAGLASRADQNQRDMAAKVAMDAAGKSNYPVDENYINSLGSEDTTPNLADERAQIPGAKVGQPLPAPSSARDVRAKSKAYPGYKSSPVRETGGPLSDQEIMDWNRKNNKNYRD